MAAQSCRLSIPALPGLRRDRVITLPAGLFGLPLPAMVAVLLLAGFGRWSEAQSPGSRAVGATSSETAGSATTGDAADERTTKLTVTLPGFDDPEPRRVIRVRNAHELRQAVREAEPGDHIRIAPGEYPGNLYFAEIRGTAERPIHIGGEDPDQPPVIRGGQQGIHIVRASHVMLHDLVIERSEINGLNIDDGMRPGGASHITLRDLHIRFIGGEGNQDGIKLSGVSHFLIERVIVDRWGVGGSGIDMVGCHHGLIRNSRFSHRPGIFSGNGVQAKGGSTQIVIRNNRFIHAAGRAIQIGGHTDLRFFRPAPQGFEARGITVEGCVIIGSQAAVAFANSDETVFRYNTVFQPGQWVLRILREQHAPGFEPTRNGVFERNLIVYDTTRVREVVNISAGTEPMTFRFRENFWFSENDARATPILPTEDRNSVIGRNPRFTGPVPGDLALSDNSPAVGFGATAAFSPTLVAEIERRVSTSASNSATAAPER